MVFNANIEITSQEAVWTNGNWILQGNGKIVNKSREMLEKERIGEPDDQERIS